MSDAWWLAVDGEVLNKPIALSDLQMRRKRYAGHRLQLLHVDEALDEHSNWIDFHYATDIRLHSGVYFGQDYPNRMVTEPARHLPPSSGIGFGSLGRKNCQEEEELNRIFNQLAMDNRSAEKVKLRLKDKEMMLAERERALLEKQQQLDLREEEIHQREKYIEVSEEALIAQTFKHEERQAEIEQLSDGMSD